MNRIRTIACVALFQTLTVLAACLVGVVGQVNAQENRAIIRMVPEPSARISSRLTVQDPVPLDENAAVRPLPELTAPARPSEQDSKKQDSKPDDAQLKNELNDALQMEDDDDDVQAKQRQRPAFGPWPKPLRAISLDIREGSGAPKDRTGELKFSPKAQWEEFDPTPKVFAWAAPDIKYQPLYFEDVALERYGQTVGPYAQSTISALRMTKATLSLPNQMHNNPPRSCDYPLGFCRPGNTVPYTIQKHCFGRADR